MTATRRLAVLPSGREVEVSAFVALRAEGYLYRPVAGERPIFYAAGLADGTAVVKRHYRRARRSNGEV